MTIESLYDRDYYRWLEQTASLLQKHQFSDLDLDNLIDEITEMAKSQEKAFKNNIVIILWHLLTYSIQPEKQTTSWELTLWEHRERIEEDLEASGSLKKFLTTDVIEKCYSKARKKASIETGIDLAKFPVECPFTVTEILDYDFIPHQKADI